MKYLIVSGDSWTDPNYYSTPNRHLKCDWPKWPELLAEKLNMQVINLAHSGRGNEYIYSTILDKITEQPDNIGMVIAAWSAPERRDFCIIGDKGDYRWRTLRPDDSGSFLYHIQRSFRLFYSFQQLCESLNLKYKHMLMVPFFKTFLWECSNEFFEEIRDDMGPLGEREILKSIINCPYIEKIREENFIGWPCVEELGGYSIKDKLNPGKSLDFQIAENDAHPSSKGHELIANYIYDRL